MTRHLWFDTAVLLTGSLIASQASPKDAVNSAARKLGAKSNYSWTSTFESPDASGGRVRIGPTDGKADKDGYVVLSIVARENTIEAVLKGGKGAIKGPGGWTGLAEVAEASAAGQRNATAFMARALQNFKAPAAQVADLVSNVKELKKAENVYSGDLSEDGASTLLFFGSRDGNTPPIANARGSVSIWLQDGIVIKYQFTVQGTVTLNNNDVNVDRTTTVEIKDVDATKVDVPEDALKKMSSVPNKD
jgi:hypothetical protein